MGPVFAKQKERDLDEREKQQRPSQSGLRDSVITGSCEMSEGA